MAWFVIEIAVKLEIVQVRNIILVFLFADTALAAVARNKLPSARKFVDGQAAVVCAGFAARHARFKAKSADLFDIEHGALTARIVFPGN